MRGGRNEWLRSVCIGCSKFASPAYFALTCVLVHAQVGASRSARSMKSTIDGMHAQTAERTAAVERELAREPVLLGPERGPVRRASRGSRAGAPPCCGPGGRSRLGIGVELLRRREARTGGRRWRRRCRRWRRVRRAAPSRRPSTPRPRRRERTARPSSPPVARSSPTPNAYACRAADYPATLWPTSHPRSRTARSRASR